MLKTAARWTFCSCFFHHPGTFWKSRAEQAVTPEQMMFPHFLLHADRVLPSFPPVPDLSLGTGFACHRVTPPLSLPPCSPSFCSVSFGHPQLPDSDIGVIPSFFQVHYFITLSQSALFNYTLYGCPREHLEQRDKAVGKEERWQPELAEWIMDLKKRDGVLFTDNRFT